MYSPEFSICKIFLLLNLIVSSGTIVFSQEYFGVGLNHFHISLDDDGCNCNWAPISQSVVVLSGSCYCPDGYIYSGGELIYQIEPISGLPEISFSVPWPDNAVGMVCMGNGIFYTIAGPNSDSLFLVDINTSIVTNVGYIGYSIISDPTLFNGQIYAITFEGIILIDHLIPSNSSLITNLNDPFTNQGLTTSHFCNQLLALDGQPGDEIIKLVNVLDGTVTSLCTILDACNYINSIYEPLNPVPCQLLLTVGCEEGSNTSYYTCLTPDGVPVTDTDIRIFADDHIADITIRIDPPIPDAPN